MRLNYLDVLKAFAIIAVVIYHSGFLTYGYLGVDIFLVIAGYLTTSGLYRKIIEDTALSGGGNFAYRYFDFEINRIVRLLPVLLVAGAICMAVGYWTMLPDDYENLSETVVATNLFANNILSAITTKNYWDVINEYKPLMHTWYVGVLMQYYLFYPLLFFIAKFDKRNTKRTLLVMITTVAVLSLLVYFGTTDTASRFYYLPSRFFEFAAGGIIALTWKETGCKRVFHSWYVYVCYGLLLILMIVNQELVAAYLKLVLIVALTVVLVMSSNSLENKITGNAYLAKIGAASYSIFVWHQVLLAFYRYMISSSFTFLGYVLLIIVVGVLSWLTYHFIEQKTSAWLKESKSKHNLYVGIIASLIGLTGFAFYIYKTGGVVRDVPELCISVDGKVNHSEYNDKIYQYDRPFETEKLHWLVVGNSFGRDFANIILESEVADSIEISYIKVESLGHTDYSDRFKIADKVFLSSLGYDESLIRQLESICLANNNKMDNIIVVSEKNFGECNGQIYVKRFRSDYHEQRVNFSQKRVILDKNFRLKEKYGKRFLDLISLELAEDGTVPVFTPDHYYISQDCEHLTEAGAKWLASLIDWRKYFD